jgi:hypothetical protein
MFSYHLESKEAPSRSVIAAALPGNLSPSVAELSE